MAFKLTQKPTFKATVTVNVPNDKAGFDKNTFTATFKRLPTAELDALRSQLNADVVRKVLVDWDLKEEEGGDNVPFGEDTLEAVLQISPSPMAIALAFWESVGGARTKN